MQRTKVIPKDVWRSMQDHSEGAPMKVNEHRKQRVREKSSRKLSSELLALTIGDVLAAVTHIVETLVKFKWKHPENNGFETKEMYVVKHNRNRKKFKLTNVNQSPLETARRTSAVLKMRKR
ncbi:hypothetical protein EYF80_048860 [Liparis tanakae]|uniref:Uncharacterized protein n=1 Tax=Liparis tanakae TaxID=230148 RepID=A0A4Z2FIF5_9TELE|nr:hypothetical protein EYF80_048860 [Liparis tanakae]